MKRSQTRENPGEPRAVRPRVLQLAKNPRPYGTRLASSDDGVSASCTVSFSTSIRHTSGDSSMIRTLIAVGLVSVRVDPSVRRCQRRAARHLFHRRRRRSRDAAGHAGGRIAADRLGLSRQRRSRSRPHSERDPERGEARSSRSCGRVALASRSLRQPRRTRRQDQDQQLLGSRHS